MRQGKSAKGSLGVRLADSAVDRSSSCCLVDSSSSSARRRSSASDESSSELSSASDDWAASKSCRAVATRDSSPRRLADLASKDVSSVALRAPCSAARVRARWSRAGGRLVVVVVVVVVACCGCWASGGTRQTVVSRDISTLRSEECVRTYLSCC